MAIKNLLKALEIFLFAMMILFSLAAAEGNWRDNWTESPEWGGRVGFVDSYGTLWVKLHYQNSEWVDVATDVQDFQLLDWHLCVLKTDGTLLKGAQELNTPLVPIDYDVAAFQLNLLYIGILKTNGDFRLVDPSGNIETIADDVTAFHVTKEEVVVLRSDHSLWKKQARGFKMLAENVSSFQLDRQYIAYVQEVEGQGNRLMMAEWGREMEWHELARGVVDFEMEVIVTPAKNFPSKVHIAVVDSKGQLLFDEADEVAELRLQPSYFPAAAQEVHWAGRCLAVKDRYGDLLVTDLDPEGNLSEWINAGPVQDFQMNKEHTLVLSRRPNELRLVRGMAFTVTDETGSGEAEADSESSAVQAVGQVKVIRGFDWDSEELVADGVALYCLSSIRPDFVRRPVYFGAPATTDAPAAAQNKK